MIKNAIIMDSGALRTLFRKYLEDGLSAGELQELQRLVSALDNTELERLVDECWQDVEDAPIAGLRSEAVYEAILHHPDVQPGKPPARRDTGLLRRLRVVGVAAVLGVAFALFWRDGQRPAAEALSGSGVAILPGGNKAVLTLADGSRVNLSEEQSGIVVRDEITYSDGSVVSKITGAPGGSAAMLTLTTPNGGTYQVTLSDGTKVWLNSASILRYPAVFSGPERIVELEGEAFFDVASQTHQKSGTPRKRVPFIVKSRHQTVEVLGTQFNISSYPDEAEVRTTLVEGSVVVVNALTNASTRLQPGMQSIINGTKSAIRQVDTESYVAWKDGYFAFPDAHITHVMRTIARWYDIEVEYEGDMTNKYFGGTLSRFEDFETLLKTIELTGSVRFKIEGRRVRVMT